jgi:hypothetical protein
MVDDSSHRENRKFGAKMVRPPDFMTKFPIRLDFVESNFYGG